MVDENGTPVPTASDAITFEATGPATIVAVDSPDPASHELFQTNERHAFQGQCIAIVRSNSPGGELKVTASAPGLTSRSVTLQASAK